MNNWIQFLFLDLYNALSVWTLVSTDKGKVSGFCSWMWSFIQWIFLVLHLHLSQQCAESWRMGENPRLQCDNVLWQKSRIQCIRNIMKKHLFQPFSEGYVPGGSNPFVAHLKVGTMQVKRRVNRRKDVFKVTVKKERSCQKRHFVVIASSPAFALGWSRKWDIRKGERCWLWWME